MGPHLLDHFVARTTGTTVADAALVQRRVPSRPRKPRTPFGRTGRRR